MTIQVLTQLLENQNFIGEVFTIRSGELAGTIANMRSEAVLPNDNYVVCGAEFISDKITDTIGKNITLVQTWNLYVAKACISQTDILPLIKSINAKKGTITTNGAPFSVLINVVGSSRQNENLITIQVQAKANYNPDCFCC